jgi:hypothetical protein
MEPIRSGHCAEEDNLFPIERRLPGYKEMCPTIKCAQVLVWTDLVMIDGGSHSGGCEE